MNLQNVKIALWVIVIGAFLWGILSFREWTQNGRYQVSLSTPVPLVLFKTDTRTGRTEAIRMQDNKVIYIIDGKNN